MGKTIAFSKSGYWEIVVGAATRERKLSAGPINRGIVAFKLVETK